MKQLVPVSSIMTQNIVKLNLADTLTKAENLFKAHHIKHIPVADGNRIVGMLSYTDLLRISYADTVDEDEHVVGTTVYNMFSIEQVMTKNVICIAPETTIKEAAEILIDNDFHSLPVCMGELLVGIVTSTDLIKYLLDQYK